MSTLIWRHLSAPFAACLLVLLVPTGQVEAQTRHWVGGNGQWNDAAHWSAVPNGIGGAGVPHSGDAVFIAASTGNVVITMGAAAEAGKLTVEGNGGQVRLEGGRGRLQVAGTLELKGNVAWAWPGTLEMSAHSGVSELDLHGIPLHGDVRFAGGGTWSMRSDLVIGDEAALMIDNGTLVTNGNMLRAGSLRLGSQGAKLMAGSSVVLLAQSFQPGTARNTVDAGSSKLLVGGSPVEWGPAAIAPAEELRAQNVCATGVGQTPFVIDAQLMSNYNGFGVSCHGVCNGQVRVVVTGGIGPFTYQWVGGPNTALWNNVCPGNQIVIVTDQGQGVSCATTVQVTDPALLSVIFTGTVPPSCAGVCNGSSTVFAVGGVPGYAYSWNNGAGTGASFNQLCPGTNNLHVTDANNCAFDSTFNYPIQPIQPNLTTTDVQCANACDGTAQVAPVGGTGSFTYNWGPGNPSGDGTAAVTGLCAGNYTVNIQDANGCDTTLQFQITQPPPILPNETHVDATCGTSCDGTATVAPTGGSGTYGYSWSPAPGGGANSATATGLCQGVYMVTITDAVTGCDTVLAITIDAPPSIIPSPASTGATCANSCDGTASAPATGGAGALTYTWSPSVNGQGTPNASQLCPGAYSVLISDGACDTTVQFTITAPPPIAPSITVVNANCAGQCNGSATLVATGGVAPLGYNWQPGNPAGDGTPAVTGLCAGAWSVTVSDANGCDTTLQFNVTEPLPISLTGTKTNVTCGGTCNGTATVTATGGSPAYTYVWSPVPPQGQGTATASQLCAGTWSVTVTDANGCQKVRNFNIQAPPVLEAFVTITPASCPGTCDGSGQAVVSGGTPLYNYTWAPQPSSGQGTPGASGLCPGPGTLTITDAAGCDTTVSFNIDAPVPVAVASTVNDASCNGNCDGSISLVPSGGTGTYTFTWVPASAGTGATAVNLCPGSYQVTVASGSCDSTFNFNVGQPPPLDISLSSTPASCSDACDGTAALSGDLSGLNFNWQPEPGSGQGTANAGGLCAGNYSVTATNAAGCDTVVNFTIAAPPALTLGGSQTNLSCGSNCDGTATVTASGGTPGFTFAWTPAPPQGQGTATASQLCAGTWSVTVTDANGCQQVRSFTIQAADPLEVFLTPSPVSCAALCDGSAQAVVSGGTPLYTYVWAPEPGSGQGTSGAGGLCAGPGTLTVSDAGGCDTTVTFTIDAPAPLDVVATVNNAGCNGDCNGSIALSASGGTGTYSYAWLPSSAGSGATAVNLCAGTYQVTVTSGGCDTTLTFNVLQGTPILASVATVNGDCWNQCEGSATVTATGGTGTLVYTWSPEPGGGQGTATATGLCQGPGSVVVSDGNGCDTTLFFDIFKSQPIQPNLTVYAEYCAGPCSGEAGAAPLGGSGVYQYQWSPAPGTGQGTSTVSGLCAGVNYTLTITDSNGCDTTVAFTVPPFEPISPVITTTAASCANSCDATATVDAVTGGVAPYTYFWNPEPAGGQGTNAATGLCPGTYTVIVGDFNGCDTTVQFSITAPTPITPQATVTPISCGGACTGAIDLDVQGGTGSYTYTWSPQPAQGQGTAHASQLCAGTWSVVVADGGGCDTTLNFVLAEPLPITVAADVAMSHCSVCNGSVVLHVTGGNGPFSFNWGAPLNTTTTDSTQTGLCAGLYTVLVTDATGCSAQVAVPVADDDGESLTMTDGATSCPNTCDGLVSVAYNCSAAPCSVVWTDMQGTVIAQATDTLSALCAGSYLAAVTNGNGCVSIDTAVVAAPLPFTANISSTPASCAGACDGTATIGISGGNGPFTYTWSPTPGGGQGTSQATGLCPGSYSVLVHEQGGCDATFNVLITAPAPVTVDAVTTNASCAGQCNASIGLTVQGGTGPFTFAWSPMPPVGQGTSSVSGLCAGTWTVLVADVNGCDTTMSFTMVEPLPLAITGSATMSHCGVCDGTASINVAGGSAPFTIQWANAGGPIGTGETINGLCAGIYMATVTDANGCTQQASVAVPDASGEQINAVDGQTLCSNACDGVVSVAYACTDAPCTVAWFDNAGNQLAQGADSLTGLCSGTYLVQVLNASGCTTVDTAQVLPSQVIIPNLSTTPVDCNNLCNGTATVGPVGGVAPYSYTWSPAPGGGQNSPQATGLCAGTYQVAIADASGCDTVVDVLITAPPPMAVQATVSQVTCNGACDGSIVLAPSGGNGFYSYAWTPQPPGGPGSNGAFNLCAGTWTVTVSDINGCDTTLSFTITEPAPLTASASSTQSNCSVCNGTVTVVPAGGTAPYTISWTQGGSPVGSGSTLTGLCAGLYNVHVVDAHGCTVDVAVPVSDAGGEALATADFMLSCPSDCNGVLDVVFNCSVPTCSINWFDAAGTNLNESGNTLSNLCAGNYFVQVTNGAGCTTIDTASVIAPPPIVANLSTTPVTCANDCDGTATVGPTGGAGGYQYNWVLGSGSASGTPSVVNLCPGSYSVTITDQAGCSITQGVLITAPQPITATAVVVPVTCNAACDGSITVMAQGGTGALQYQWSPEPGTGQGTNTATGLCAGAWTVTIADTNGCDTTFTLTLSSPPVLNVAMTHTDNVCYTDCNATAHADITGGVPPYSINWAGPGGTTVALDTTDVSGLCGGEYILTVTDARGCTNATPFTVASGLPIAANLVFQGETCNGPCDGTASVAPTGGSGSGYTYNWQPGNPVGQGTDQVSGLCPGNWTVTITDGAGCDTTYAFTIAPFTPITPVATVQQVPCNGACNGSISLNTTGGVGNLSYAWTPDPGTGQGTATAGGLCAGQYSVTITDAAGCDTVVSYTITEPTALLAVVDTVVSTSCNSAPDGAVDISISGGAGGYTVAWAGPNGFVSGAEDINGLFTGSYQAIVTDSAGCQTTVQVNVGTLNNLTANAGPDVFMCSGGDVVLDGSGSQGGSTYQWTDAQGGPVGTDTIVNLGAMPDGVYTYVLTVTDGPCTDADTVVFTVWPMPIADAGPDKVVYVEGTTGLGGSPSGPPGSSFVWQPDSLLNNGGVPNPDATVNATTWFQLTVTSTEGCVGIDSVLVTVVPEVKVPSGFTPNGDGHNDTWVLDFAVLFPDIDVQVFSRWGEPLFRSIGYHVPWDGKYDGKLVPMGTYYYVIELHDPRFPEALTGPLTVIR